MSIRIAVLMACHNRRVRTLTCLHAIMEQKLDSRISLQIYVVDDGSADGTSDAIASKFPMVRIMKGDGSLFWNGGMRVAYAEAMKVGFDYCLWLNDDTILYHDAIVTLVETASSQRERTGQDGIIAGSVEDPSTGQITYGGNLRGSWINRLKIVRVKPENGQVLAADTMNGNCVLIPHSVAERIGNIDGVFVHSMGDFDYGLRARAKGIPIWVAPKVVGACFNDHVVQGSFNDRELSVIERLRIATSKKALPMRSWFVFCRRHAGIFWLLIWALPYLKIVMTGNIKRR